MQLGASDCLKNDAFGGLVWLATIEDLMHHYGPATSYFKRRASAVDIEKGALSAAICKRKLCINKYVL